MNNDLVGQCPVCGKKMEVTELECTNCKTKVKGQFKLNKFSRLSADQLEFVEIFLTLRGNIKEVEEKLGISYPTVRKKLDEIIRVLGSGMSERSGETNDKEKGEVLNELDNGEISAKEAIDKLKNI